MWSFGGCTEQTDVRGSFQAGRFKAKSVDIVAATVSPLVKRCLDICRLVAQVEYLRLLWFVHYDGRRYCDRGQVDPYNQGKARRREGKA